MWRNNTASPVRSGQLYLHRLAVDVANGVGVAVGFDVAKFVVTARDGVQIVVAQRAAGAANGRGGVGSPVHDICSSDRSGAVIASVLSMAGEYPCGRKPAVT